MITAYDGDRVMAVYIGDSKNSSAVRTALKLNFAVERIINPGITDIYPRSRYFGEALSWHRYQRSFRGPEQV